MPVSWWRLPWRVRGTVERRAWLGREAQGRQGRDRPIIPRDLDLHFEWHPDVIPTDPYQSAYGDREIGTAIDPYPYLNEVC